jgi:hypothetical protein
VIKLMFEFKLWKWLWTSIAVFGVRETLTLVDESVALATMSMEGKEWDYLNRCIRSSTSQMPSYSRPTRRSSRRDRDINYPLEYLEDYLEAEYLEDFLWAVTTEEECLEDPLEDLETMEGMVDMEGPEASEDQVAREDREDLAVKDGGEGQEVDLDPPTDPPDLHQEALTEVRAMMSGMDGAATAVSTSTAPCLRAKLVRVRSTSTQE